MVLLKEAPYKEFDHVTCDKWMKKAYASEGIIHCKVCEEDFCITCAELRLQK